MVTNPNIKGFLCVTLTLNIVLLILWEPHQDEAFVQGLVEDLERQLRGVIGQSCYFSLAVDFSPVGYVTNEHLVENQS